MPHKPATHRPLPADVQARLSRAGRNRPGDPFYTSGPWRTFRAWFLGEHPACADCDAHGIATPATEVHHTTKRRDLPEDRWYDAGVCRGLCKGCHSRRTAQGE